MTHFIVRLIHCSPGDWGGGRGAEGPLCASHARTRASAGGLRGPTDLRGRDVLAGFPCEGEGGCTPRACAEHVGGFCLESYLERFPFKLIKIKYN